MFLTPTVLTRFNQLAAAGEDMVRTDIPTDQVDRLIRLAEKARNQKISNLALVPPMISTARPDLALIRAKVGESLAQAEAADASAAPTPDQAPPRVDGARDTSARQSASGSDDASRQSQSGQGQSTSQRSGGDRQAASGVSGATGTSGSVGNAGRSAEGDNPGNCSAA